MNGIENIEKRILAEAEEKASQIMKEAEKKASSITEEYEAKTSKEIALVDEKSKFLAEDIKAKAHQADEMERRKRIAGKRHEIVSEVFQKALDTLLNLGDEDYFNLLVTLSENAVADGMGGEVILNKADREKFGTKLCDRLNADLLNKKVDGAKDVVASVVGDLKEGNIPNVANIAKKATEGLSGKLVTLSDETADIRGGVVIRRGKVEYNCDIAVMIRILSEDMASEVHDRLFPKGA